MPRVLGVSQGGRCFLVGEVPLYWIDLFRSGSFSTDCADRVLDGPASGGKGSKGMIQLDCIREKGPLLRRSLRSPTLRHPPTI